MIWQVNDLAWRVIDLIWRVKDLIWQVSDLIWSVSDLIRQVNDGYFSVGTESGREADVWGVSGRFQGRPHHHPSSDVVWRQSLTLTQPLSFPHLFSRHSAGLHLQISPPVLQVSEIFNGRETTVFISNGDWGCLPYVAVFLLFILFFLFLRGALLLLLLLQIFLFKVCCYCLPCFTK